MTFNNDLIYGKDNLENIVSCEVEDDKFILFVRDYGKLNKYIKSNENWVLSSKPLSDTFEELEGNLHYKWGKIYTDNNKFKELKPKFYKHDTYFINDDREANLIIKGLSYYKGLKPKDLHILSFDIETTGVLHNDKSKLLLITNTFRHNDKIERKLFSYDQYEHEGKMIEDWCKWIREKDPDLLIGHNIISFDIPYIDFIAKKYKVKLKLGRDNSELRFNKRASRFRVDGNRDQEFINLRCFGREMLDTYFLSMQYDIAKKYESYGLKQVIKQENLEDTDRTFYDASKIRDNYLIKEEWEKIKKYAINDADDPIKLYDRMIPAFFYTANNIPKTFQQIMLSATGSKINAILVRSYLQHGHSIPKTEEQMFHVEGAISEGIPGIHKNVIKIDLKSAYPSQILRFKLCDYKKDPKQHLYKLTKYIFNERIKLKELYKKTNDINIKAQDDAYKALANSIYGALNTIGLNFNSSKLAAKITRETRQIIEFAVEWATGKNYQDWRLEHKLDGEQSQAS
jgi:DNA polymerase elongation subunit (family B)